MSRWIVVGSGAAGAVLAARLSERGDRDVLLLEAGPRASTEPSSDSFFDVLAERGRTFPGLEAVRVDGETAEPYRRGRGLGGSSAVNAMIMLRGGPFETDHLIPEEVAPAAERGPVDRALLAAAPDAEAARLARRDGRRVTVADAYLASPRPSLEIRTDAPVDRVLLDGRRAVGVRLVDGTEELADHVVLSAGAIHSPAVLLRSGVDTPGVGAGLKDHASAPIAMSLRADARADPSSLAVTTLLRRGHLHVLPLNHLGRSAPGYGMLLPALMRVRSEGSVTLRDPDPTVEPSVRFGMLSDPADSIGLAAAVRIALDLLDTEPFREIVTAAYVDDHGTPASSLVDLDAVLRWLPTHVGDYVHAACSCRMGVVVDDRCHVIGYDGLSVCDASVFADIPEVNTQLPTVMLAETMAAAWSDGGR